MKLPVLDKTFVPAVAVWRAYGRDVAALPREQRTTVVLGVRRTEGAEAFAFEAFADGVGDARACCVAERIAKTLLWAYGGYRIEVCGSEAVYRRLKEDYRIGGARAFDAAFMSRVYERPFEVVLCDSPTETVRPFLRAGGFTRGCRIGFDAGGSDRKVSAVIDGNVVYSEEVVWNPKTESDPAYHRREIAEAFRTAASKMPRVDCIGVSSAGVYVGNRAMEASLFLKVDKSVHGEEVKNIYLDAAKEFRAPIVVANDGDVTALAGSLELGEGRVLGIAMGTSEAAGYINEEMGLNGWLSELAFAPADVSASAARDEWSGDLGVGCKYFSQDAVIRLAELGGHAFAAGLTPAQKLSEVQKMLSEGSPLAAQVFSDLGVYLGHTLPYYALFYPVSHVLLLGRVMSGKGGELILSACKETLAADYPEFTARLHLPSEKGRRVGQCIAAASLPEGPAEEGEEI